MPAVRCAPSSARSKMADADTDADEPESNLSDLESEGNLSNLHAPNEVPLSKIPKPPGEAGRPGSGGFNLEETLGWPKEYFNKIQVRYETYVVKNHLRHHIAQKETQDLVTTNLEESNSYNKQPSYKIDRICRKVRSAFDILTLQLLLSTVDGNGAYSFARVRKLLACSLHDQGKIKEQLGNC